MKSIWNISCISCLGSCSWFQKSNTGLHKHARKAYESCYAYLALPFLTFGKQIFFLNTKIFQSPDQNVSFVTHGISHNPCTPTFTHTHMKIDKMDEGLIPQISAWNGLDKITAPSLRTRLFLIDMIGSPRKHHPDDLMTSPEQLYPLQRLAQSGWNLY